MSEATDTLAAVKYAYKKALNGETVRFGDRQYTSQDLSTLLDHIKFWTGEVEAENSLAAGRKRLTPLQMIPR